MVTSNEPVVEKVYICGVKKAKGKNDEDQFEISVKADWSLYPVRVGKSKTGGDYPTVDECPEIFKKYNQMDMNNEFKPIVDKAVKKDKPKPELFKTLPSCLIKWAKGELKPEFAEKTDLPEWAWNRYLVDPFFDVGTNDEKPVGKLSTETTYTKYDFSQTETEDQDVEEEDVDDYKKLQYLKDDLDSNQQRIMRQSAIHYAVLSLSEEEKSISTQYPTQNKVEYIIENYAKPFFDYYLLNDVPPYIKDHQPIEATEETNDTETQQLLDQAEEEMETPNE